MIHALARSIGSPIVTLLCAGLLTLGCGDSVDNGGTGGTGGGTGGTGGATGGTGGSGDAGGSGGAPIDGSIVFVTETVQDGALAGIDGANGICQAQADAAGLGGTFVAWLSTQESSVADRLVQSASPYVLVDGTLIANDWADLVDGTIQAPINLDANGERRGGDVWTGTLTTGESFLDDDCAGFTSSSAGFGLCGSTATAGEPWTENITPACGTRLRLYCFEQ